MKLRHKVPVTPKRRPSPNMPIVEQLQRSVRLLVASPQSYTELRPLWDAWDTVSNQYLETLAPLRERE